MPELPEIQALAERVADFAAGRELTSYAPLQFSSLKTYHPSPEALLGRTLERTGRRGKYLILDFGELHLLIHLSQGGRIDLEEPAKKTKPRGAVARFVFGDRAVFVKEFGTDRKAGWWVVAADDAGPMSKLGPEVDSPEFAEIVRAGTDTRRVHTILRDQRTVAGMGRGYSDDVLHRARISPFASLASLDPAQREALLDAIRDVLAEALEAERARTGGLPTKLGDHFTVHNAYGKPCPRCGEDLRRVSYESHEVTYCPACQTGGKILADRRLSRLVK